MTRFTDCAHNILFRLDRAKWLSDMAVSSRASIVGYSEADSHKARRVLTQHCRDTGRGLFDPVHCGNPISWDSKVWTPIPKESGVVEVHRRVNIPRVKFNPARDFAWVGLEHNVCGTKVLRINVHPIAGATKPEPNKYGPRLNEWKDWAVRQYWLDVVSFTAAQMSREKWDVILLGGDFNGRLENRREWWYPGPLLSSLYFTDDAPRSIDRLVWTRDSLVRQEKRWVVAKGIHSDHHLHFAEYVTT